MHKILLVEDNEGNRDMLSRRLLRRGFDVRTAVSGEEGLSIARREGADLILMDLSLPGLDGWEAARCLKSIPETSSIPIIALTAHAMTHDHGKAIDAGCDDYETKPVDMTRLMEKMQMLLNRRATP